MGGRGARITIYRPASVGLSQFGLARPLPERLKDRERAAERFDFETLFFDVFRSPATGSVQCLGPPLDGCIPGGMPPRFMSADGAVAPKQRLEPPRIPQQNTSRLTVADPGGGTLLLDIAGTTVRVAVNPPHDKQLSGCRVLVTLCKDYPLRWIADWATFYVRLHGADAVLLYDNGSTAYGPDELGAALADIPGLREVAIVAWPFRYGVGGRPGDLEIDNFCQTGALDHARRCFCAEARSVLNVDIDELLPPGDQPVFEQVETSGYAVLLFRGVWAEAPDVTSRDDLSRVRHADCSYVWQSQMNMLMLGQDETLCRTKWAAVPARCAADVEWGVHDIYPADKRAHNTQREWRTLNRFLAYRHCRQINTGWKIDRWQSSPNFDDVCTPDPEMAAAFSLAFDEFAG